MQVDSITHLKTCGIRVGQTILSGPQTILFFNLQRNAQSKNEEACMQKVRKVSLECRLYILKSNFQQVNSFLQSVVGKYGGTYVQSPVQSKPRQRKYSSNKVGEAAKKFLHQCSGLTTWALSPPPLSGRTSRGGTFLRLP